MDRRDLRVLAARKAIDAENLAERQQQQEAFCEELHRIFEQLAIEPEDMPTLRSQFRKAVMHRVEPRRHVCPAFVWHQQGWV